MTKAIMRSLDLIAIGIVDGHIEQRTADELTAWLCERPSVTGHDSRLAGTRRLPTPVQR